MKRLAIVLVMVVAAMLLLAPGVASANYAIHGGYTQNTDACAGCHRAHTSVSSITWNDPVAGQDHSALLTSNATEIYEFCYACHDDAGQGANTNVQSGVYLARTGSVSASSTLDAPLNGGGFEDIGGLGGAITSKHGITGSWGAYGGGWAGQGATGASGVDTETFASLGTGNQIEMTCASCHDPHGSSNYRLLADKVNGNTVGGYSGALGEVPDPFVISVEQGYPNGNGGSTLGWLKHDAGQVQMAGYVPNYTKPEYAKAPGDDVTKGMTGWCAGCHTVYQLTGTPHDPAGSVYDSADGWGLVDRHRHPMNVALTAYSGLATLTPAAAVPLPLANDVTESGAATNTASDWIDCLTCHYAHGTTSTMSGYANVSNSSNPGAGDYLLPDSGGSDPEHQGVAPAGTSALLRRDNRGVCEVCHNK